MDGTARLWIATSGQQLLAIRGHRVSFNSAAFSPDGRRIVTTGEDTIIWDATTGQELLVLHGDEGPLNGASFCPNGVRIVTVEGRIARIWDATSGAALTVFDGHQDVLSSAQFSEDGARIITASYDRTARIWDAATGAELTLIAVDAKVIGLDVHRGKIVLGDGLGRIHVFDAGEFVRG